MLIFLCRAEEEADFSAYSFRGDGYAILPQIKRYKKRSYVVALRFRTFDENALLFFAPNVQTVSWNFIVIIIYLLY